MLGIITIAISTMVTVVLFFMSKIGNPRLIEGWTFLAQSAGLIGSIFIAWNFILATRFKFIEKMFEGLDKVYKIHNILGNLAFILVVNHPLFLIISALPFNTTKLYLVPTISNLPYAFGILALYSLIVLITLTIFLDIPYKLWKKTHEYIGIVIILGSLHSLLISSDVSVYFPLKAWILLWNIIAILAYLYKRFGYYIYIPKNNYTVINVTQDKDYLLLDLTPSDPNKVILFDAGQFAFISLDNDRRDDHPFSILEQNGGNLKFGTKVVGPFTVLLSQLHIGSKINIYGPYGNFSSTLDKPKDLLFISGGIGITPFLSMIKALRSDQNVTMIHTSRSDESHLFTDMYLKYMSIYPNFKFILHYSDKSGHLNNESISKYVVLSSDSYVYLCGPKNMMDSLSLSLPNLGVKQKRIIYEDFTLK